MADFHNPPPFWKPRPVDAEYYGPPSPPQNRGSPDNARQYHGHQPDHPGYARAETDGGYGDDWYPPPRNGDQYRESDDAYSPDPPPQSPLVPRHWAPRPAYYPRSVSRAASEYAPPPSYGSDDGYYDPQHNHRGNYRGRRPHRGNYRGTPNARPHGEDGRPRPPESQYAPPEDSSTAASPRQKLNPQAAQFAPPVNNRGLRGKDRGIHTPSPTSAQVDLNQYMQENLSPTAASRSESANGDPASLWEPTPDRWVPDAQGEGAQEKKTQAPKGAPRAKKADTSLTTAAPSEAKTDTGRANHGRDGPTVERTEEAGTENMAAGRPKEGVHKGSEAVGVAAAPSAATATSPPPPQLEINGEAAMRPPGANIPPSPKQPSPAQGSQMQPASPRCVPEPSSACDPELPVALEKSSDPSPRSPVPHAPVTGAAPTAPLGDPVPSGNGFALGTNAEGCAHEKLRQAKLIHLEAQINKLSAELEVVRLTLAEIRAEGQPL